MEDNLTLMYNDTESNFTTTVYVPNNNGGVPRPQLTLSDILMQYSEYVWAENLGIYCFPIIIGLGTIGNVLSFLVMIRRSMIVTPTCFYMAILAISDTIILYIDCLRKWFFITFGDNSWNLNTASCRVVYFLSYTSFHYSVWIIVAMTTERFFAIRYPLKFLTLGTVKKTKIACLILLIFFVLLNSQFTWSVKIKDDGKCVPIDEDYQDFHSNIIPWVDATFYSYLPFIILITFNVLIIWSFKKARRRQKNLHGDNASRKQTSQSRASINHRMTAMLLSVTFTFLILTAPKAILFCIRNEVFMFLKYPKRPPNFQEVALYLLISRIADLCIYANHAINFILYCVSGQRFRKEMKLLCSCGKLRRDSFSVNSSSRGPQISRYHTMQTVSSNYGLYDNDNSNNEGPQENSV